MVELFCFLGCYILLAAISGAFSYMLWVFMGMPVIGQSEDGAQYVEYNKGMIFSGYTAWLGRKFAEADKARQDWQEAHVKQARAKFSEGSEEYLEASLKAWEQGENRLNIYKALGACLICFAGQINNLVGLGLAFVLYWHSAYWVFWVITGLFFWSTATFFTKLFVRWQRD